MSRGIYNKVAADYDRHAWVQHEIAEGLMERLEFTRLQPERVIDLGAGTGRGATLLRKRYPKAWLAAVDLSNAMLAEARRTKVMDAVVAADARQLPFAPDTLDLVFASSVLQWCDPLQTALSEICRVLRSGGVLTFSTYGPDTLCELRQAQEAGGFSGMVNEFEDMHVIGDRLLDAGFQDPVVDVERMVVPYESVADLLRDIRGIGSHRLAPPAKGLTSPARWQAMIEAYPLQAGEVTATYEVIYGYALGPHPGDEDGVTRVPLSSLISRI